MFTKAKLFNLALGALLLSRQINNPDTDTTNEARVLNTHWDVALNSTLEDLDLDQLSMPVTLELIATDPNDHWAYAYKYPNNCAFLRRIQSCVVKDNEKTWIEKRTGLYGTPVQRAIFTNEQVAIAEIIPVDLPLSALPANAGLAIAYRLAILSAPLNVGKGAKNLMKDIEAKYVLAKSEAQEKDRAENFVYDDPETESQFVSARMS